MKQVSVGLVQAGLLEQEADLGHGPGVVARRDVGVLRREDQERGRRLG